MVTVPCRLLILLALTGLAGPALAQGALTGRVLDAATEEPVPTASVALFDGEALVTGVATGMDGRFRLEGVPAGIYAVEVSFLGYDAVRRTDVRLRDGRTTDLGTVALAPDVAALDEVEVTAQRRTVQVEIDRLVYSTADDPLTVGGSATDVLETIPSVEVDLDGNVSLRGSGSVAVHINGRPAPVTADMVADYLAALPAGVVDRVEVIPNPSARYEPDGMAGIINIVLRQDADPGLGGSLAAMADSRGGVSTTNLLTFGHGPWSLSATYTLRRDLRERERATLRINRGLEPLVRLDQTSLDDRTRFRQRLGLTAERTFGPRTSASLALAADTRSDEEERRLAALRAEADGDFAAAFDRVVVDGEDRLGGDARLGLRHQFGDERDHRLELDLRGNVQQRDRIETLLEQPFDGAGTFAERRTDQDRRNQLASFDLDCRRPALGGRVEAGYSGFVRLEQRDFLSESRADPDAPFSTDAGLTNETDYALWIHAVYAQVGREFGPLGTQIGLRAETASTDFTLVSESETFTNRYASLFPSAFLSLALREGESLRGSYSRRVRRPRTHHYNPFPRFDDPTRVYVGNPAIRPEYTDAFELGYVRLTDWGSVTVGPYLRHSTDLIRDVVTIRPDGVTELTVANLASSTSFGMEAVTSVELGAVRGFLGLEGFRVNTDGEALGADVTNDAFGWGGRLNATLDAEALGLAGLTVQGAARFRAAMRTEQGRAGSRLFMDFALRQQLFGDRASLNLRLRDPFALARFDYVLDQPLLYEEVRSDWGARRIDLTFSVRFNQPERRREARSDEGDFEEAF